MQNNEYLTFTKKERRGIVILVTLIIMVSVLPKYFFPTKKETIPHEETQLQLLSNRDTNKADVHNVISEKRPMPVRTLSSATVGDGRNMVRDSRNTRTSATRDKYVYRPLAPIDINKADTLTLQQLPGIGSKLANRIVLFRKKLGGFESVEQVRRVYGLKDSVYRIIKPSLFVTPPEREKSP